MIIIGIMNKKTIITALLALVALTGQSQEIKRVTETAEDFMEHMSLYGYKVFTYDISTLRDSVSSATIVIREYNQQGMIGEKKLYGFRTRNMIADFNEADQQEIYANNEGDDMERGIYRLSKTLSIGFSPVTSDSIETITLRTARNNEGRWDLKLKPIPGAPQTVYRYEKVPYQPGSFQRDTFIPLVLYGSFWWDEDAKTWRFCGTEELTDEKAKTSNFFKDLPHYYIIGAIFHK